MAGTGNCQVVVTASGKLKGEGAQVFGHYSRTGLFQYVQYVVIRSAL